jgi:hypothetical protein
MSGNAAPERVPAHTPEGDATQAPADPHGAPSAHDGRRALAPHGPAVGVRLTPVPPSCLWRAAVRGLRLSTSRLRLPTMDRMGSIGTERREVEFEPLPDRPLPEPEPVREPATPAVEPERT